jgi:hypothetical protein
MLPATTPAHKARSAKIAPKGEVHFGNAMLLEQRSAGAEPSAAFRFVTGLPDSGAVPVIDDPTPESAIGELPMRRLEYSLRETATELCVRNDGLTMSYGIFGAPGSGKTYLLMYMLEQLLGLPDATEETRCGALILDPKAALIEDTEEMARAAGRFDDLVVVNADRLDELDEAVNVIAADLDSAELARALVLAAQSAGVGASEPYWFGAWQNLWAAAIMLLKARSEPLTLRRLVDVVLLVEPRDELVPTGPKRQIQWIAADVTGEIAGRDDDEACELRAAISQIDRFYAQEPNDVAVVENIIAQSYGEFQRARCKRFCGASGPGFYDQIIDEGKIVLVSISPSEPGLAKVVCTLVKNLFMQSVRSRLDRVRAGRLQNFERPVVLACDEYSQVASEIPGQTGDGDFFSIARQQGCMGLLATQSVNVLQATSLKEHWKSIFSNFAAKFFMKAVDNETVEEATKLAGETDWYVSSLGSSSGAQGFGSSAQRDLRERKVLPSHVLTQLVGRGEGVVIGTLDGRSRPATHFFTVRRRC